MKLIVKVSIPIRGRKNKDLSLFHKKLKEVFATRYGGYTYHKAMGGWVNERGIYFEEEVIVYTVYVSPMEKESAVLRIQYLLKKYSNLTNIFIELGKKVRELELK